MDWDYFFLGLLIIIAIPIIIFGIPELYNNKKNEIVLWNNGYCQCGGMYEYYEAVGHRTGTTYMYKCNSCGKMIERNNLE